MKILLSLSIAICCIATASADVKELLKKGDSHDAKFQFDKALEFYLPAEKLEPKNAELLVKISRQYALKMNDLPKDKKAASGRTALAYADRAVKAAPSSGEAHLSVAICLGKLSPYMGSKERIEASRRIKTEADQAVRLDPQNDYAWHLLGRWHQSLANIGGPTRAMASMIYGQLPAASNEEAVRCFKKAIALNSKRLIHVVELGRTYALMGRKAEAIKYLNQGLGMPNLEYDDSETKQRGRESLKDVS